MTVRRGDDRFAVAGANGVERAAGVDAARMLLVGASVSAKECAAGEGAMTGAAGGAGVATRDATPSSASGNTEEIAHVPGLCCGSVTSGESASSGAPPVHASVLSLSPDGLARSLPSVLRSAVRSMSLPLSPLSIVGRAALSTLGAAARRDAETAPKSAFTRCARLGVAATATAAAAAAAAVATASATAAARDARSSSPPRLPPPPPPTLTPTPPPPLQFSLPSTPAASSSPPQTSMYSVRTAAGVTGSGDAIAGGAGGGADEMGARQIDARGTSEARGAGWSKPSGFSSSSGAAG
jgi:hypothetical protein